MKNIKSAANPRFKTLQKLVHSSRERRKAGMSILDGSHLVAAYLQYTGRPDQIAVSQSGLANCEIQSLLGALAPLEPLVLSDALFQQVSTVATPTGLLAAVKTPRPRAVPRDAASCLLLEDIQDPGNLGSMLRSAASAGIKRVFLSRDSVHAWSPRVLRAGMGAHFVLEIFEQVDLADFARGFSGAVIATSHGAGENLFDVDLTGCVAIVMGNEGNGVSPALMALASRQVAIPMPGRAESLNVAAAAAVCLFERVRQLRRDKSLTS